MNIIDNLDNLSQEERKGIYGKSLLLTVPNFNLISQASAEYLHSTCLGLIKKLVSLTFQVGESKQRITRRKLSKPSTFNVLMAQIRTPRESSRRARDLDFSVLKGAEFRNMALFFFPLVLDCIEEGHGERKLWLYLAYMVRSCTIPNPEFDHVNKEIVKDCCDKYYNLYERLMGQINCTYNTHVTNSHLLDIQKNVPLRENSAFVFESFYGEMRHCFVPKTISPLKQIMQKIFLKRTLSFHSCEIPIFYSNYNTSLENNSTIYCWENDEHNIYVIEEIIDDDNFLCKKVGKYQNEFIDVPRLDWSVVGVYRKGGVGPDNVVVKRSSISGKVIEVKNLLITWPNNILREK